MIEKENYGDVTALHQGKKFLGFYPPYMSVRCYAVDGLLIDSGLSCFSKQVLQFAKENKVGKAIITHHHEDHSGNGLSLKNEGVAVFASQATSELLQNGFARYFYQRVVWAKAPRTETQTVPVTIETLNHVFEVLEAPGHCDDQIVLYEPKRGWLFTGDAFLSSKIKYFREDEDFKKTVTTLENLCQLSFDQVFCAHNPVLDQGHKSLKRKLDYLKDLEVRVKELHAQGYSLREITSKVMGRENYFLFCISMGDLSKINLIKSILFGPKLRASL